MSYFRQLAFFVFYSTYTINLPFSKEFELEKVRQSPTASNMSAQIGDNSLTFSSEYLDAARGSRLLSEYIRVRAKLPCLTPFSGPDPGMTGQGWGSLLTLQIRPIISGELVNHSLLKTLLENNDPPNERGNADRELSAGHDAGGDFTRFENHLLDFEYFVHGPDSDQFVIQCSRISKVPFPSCSKKTALPNGLLIRYQYGRSWIDRNVSFSLVIDQYVNELVARFLSSDPNLQSSTDGVC